MSRPVFLVAPRTLDDVRRGACVALSGPEGRHAASVRRVRPGEHVDLVDGGGVRARAAVAAVGPAEVDLTVLAWAREPRWVPSLVLLQALAKGDRDERAIEAATEVGVDAVVPWHADRSVSQWSGPKVERGRARWGAVVTAAAKQARRSRVPEVRPLVSRSGAAALAAATIAKGGAVVVLHEQAERQVRDTRLPDRGELMVVVGPEGGLTDAEVAALAGAGAQVARLGPHVLRTSTAGPVALALLAERLGHWAVPADDR